MKRNFRLFVFTPLQILFFSLRASVFVTGFIFIFSLCLFLPELNATTDLLFPDPDVTISMDLQDTSLKDILKIFSIQSGLNFIASEAVQERTVTLYLDKVPIKQAMDKLFKANNLSYELDRDSSVMIVKDWGKPQIDTETRVFYLKYATVSTSSLKEEMANQISAQTTTEGAAGGGGGAGEKGKWAVEEDSGITKAVKKLLSEHGSIIEDYRTNSLIITDIPSRMPIIAKIIAALDVRVPQVMLEVEMLDVSKNTVDKLGINWSGISGSKLTLAPAQIGTYFPFHKFLFDKGASGQTRQSQDKAGSLSISSLSLILDFLRTQTDTKYLARPRLLTLNNETAEIKITTNESIGVTTTSSTTAGTSSATPERSETGVLLRVTPQINKETGEVTMFVYPQVAEATTGNSITGATSTGAAASYTFRDPEVRSTKTMVRVKDGETVIIGGLIRHEFTQTRYKIPILGDLPLIGLLFRHKGGPSTSSPDKNKQRELLVFITPHIVKDIVKDTNVELAQAKKIGFPEREQNTVSGIDRQATISSSLNSFEKKKK